MTQTTHTGSKLQQVLKAGHFAMTAETSPPDAASAEVVLNRVNCLKGIADAVNVTDGASARAHMSATLTTSCVNFGSFFRYTRLKAVTPVVSISK